jgi:putative endonuclease
MNDHERQALRRAAGQTAEDLAAAEYEKAGARILARNHRLKCGELDLIVEERVGSQLMLVFVEVRARSERASWESPAESLTPSKLRKLRSAASLYLASYRGAATCVRFDLASWNHETLQIHRNFWWY